MDQFCGSVFWDLNLTWNTETPQFTPCFEETVLVWIPCGFLAVFSVLEFLSCRNSKYAEIPFGWLNVSKLIGIGILISITFFDIIFAYSWHPADMKMYPVDYTTGIIKHVTFIYAFYLIILRRRKGVRTSAVLFLFWFFLVVCSIPHYIRELSMAFNNTKDMRSYPYISNVIYFPIILTMLYLEMFIDSRPIYSKYPPSDNPSRRSNVSFVNDLFIIWYDKFAFGFYNKNIQMSDLWGLDYRYSLEYLVPLFNKKWAEKAESIIRKIGKRKPKKMNGYQRMRIEERIDGKQREISIISILWNCFYNVYIPITLLKVVVDCMMFVSPQILSLLIDFEQSDEPVWRGYLYMIGLVLCGMITTIFLNAYVFSMFQMGLRLRSVLMAVVFRKVLKISNGAKKIFTVGDISNLMSVDAQRFYDLNLYMNMAISAPFTITASLYFLWQILGPSALAGAALMVIIVPLNGYSAGIIKQLQTKQMKYKDERVKITNEILTGIKVLKMYAWESSFEQKINEIRDQEIKMLRYAAYINSGISFIWTMAPFLVSLVTFAVFTFVDENNVLTAEIAFVSLSLFNVMKLPISLVPRFVANVTQAYVSAKRINKFLNSEELDCTSVTHDKTEAYPLIIENGSFRWDEDEDAITLKNINVKITKGSLVAVVGPVGSGKSSLLSAFLGEMNKLEGRVNTVGSIAYSSQQAWLQNATLRDNILFMKPYQKSTYNKVIDSCALLPDFQVLPAADFTEIGEKGVNLSGGQKQRISLARSVYSDSDVYLLDDPLSAVDAHVGKHIFEKVIGPTGLLRKKTRLFVTNAITYLSETDYIVVMKNGSIVESGTYPELMAKKGEFSEFISNFSLDQESVEETNEIFQKPIYERTLSEEPQSHSEPAPSMEERHSSEPVVGEKLIEQERIEEGQVKWAVYKYYIKSGGTILWTAAIIFNILFQVFSVIANLVLTDWSTDPEIVGNGTIKNPSKRFFYLELYTLYGIAQIITVVLASLSMYLATTCASAHLHRKLIEKVLRWPSFVFDITPLGRILNRFSYDIDVVDNTFPFTLRQLFILGGPLLSTLYIICYSTPIFVVMIVPITAIYIYVEQVYVGIMRQLKRLESVSRTPVYSHFSETITGAPLIRAYGMETDFVLESERRIYENQICTSPNLEAQKWVGLRLDNLGNLIILLSSLFAVLERGTKNAGVISLSVTYALQVTGALNWVIRTATDIETNIVSVERIKDFDNSPEEKLKSSTYKSVPKNWPNKGVIVFDKYKTRYREGLDFVLHGLNLRIESGEKIGIVGRTGAGKSSLTLSLFRIVEAAEGSIIIDGINIADIELKILRSRITIIPQDPVLFSGSVRLNLDPFFEYSDLELWNALSLAHLKEFVISLPNGLYYTISEGGGNLSIGQRQLICLARALLRKTKILVLDEATAAIDLETDELIQKTIRREFKDCTVLTIAHKLNTIMDSDRIVVLDQGVVKEFDSPANLLQSKDSTFYSMAKEAGLAN